MKKSKNAFNKDDLLRTIKLHSSAFIYYVSGYDNMSEYKISASNLERMLEYLREKCDFKGKVEEYDIIFVCYNPRDKRYYLERAKSKEYIYINNDSRDNLKILVRFLKKPCTWHEKEECCVCFNRIRNDVSCSMYNALTHTCGRCFNTIYITCYIKMQDETKYTCCFCKLETTVPNSIKITIHNHDERFIDSFDVEKDKYNKTIMRIDELSREDVLEDVMKRELDSYLTR